MRGIAYITFSMQIFTSSPCLFEQKSQMKDQEPLVCTHDLHGNKIHSRMALIEEKLNCLFHMLHC